MSPSITFIKDHDGSGYIERAKVIVWLEMWLFVEKKKRKETNDFV